MATKHGQKPNVPVDPGAGWEKRDVNIKGLFQFAFWMAVVLFITLLGMRFSFDSFKNSQPLGATASPMVHPTDRMLPPSPRLQVQPHQELVDYCAAQQREVNTYAWVDQQSGVARIPVERAEELILARGLPVRASSAASAMVAPATVAGETDVQGQCGYLTEPTEADKEREEAERLKSAEEK